ncbi:dual serine/threonine and tyrosine protein kinase-like [Patiria miniata]|uniref:Dual serine/threonine and tyrosine protein kinase n=1 Tax=Patiria miniata TaxID=46514 RepID=A0A913ZRE8_PATMI|nr:dual serine/threonine and tyrosine protein kinase-like [Patiria miniata]
MADRRSGSRAKTRDLPWEFRQFNNLTKQLKKIVYDTNISQAELRSCGHFEEERISALLLQDEHESFMKSIVSDPPCLLIYGQTYTAKAVLLNRILNEQILRVTNNSDNAKSWRPLRFRFGAERRSALTTLTDSFELLNGDYNPGTNWTVLPQRDVEIQQEDLSDPCTAQATTEVTLNHPLLATKVEIIVAPHNCPELNPAGLYSQYSSRMLPIILYGIDKDYLSQDEQSELLELRHLAPDLPVLFLDCCPHTESNLRNPQMEEDLGEDSAYDSNNEDLMARSVEDPLESRHRGASSPAPRKPSRFHDIVHGQLRSLGFLKDPSEVSVFKGGMSPTEEDLNQSRLEKLYNMQGILMFVRQVLQLYLTRATTILHDLHLQCMNMFITTAFDMQRDIQITPRRIDYARQREMELFESLKELANQRQEEIRKLIQMTIQDIKEPLLQEAENYQFEDLEISIDGELSQGKEIRGCTAQIQELVLNRVNTAVVEKLISSVDYLHDSFVGTLTRCLESLEKGEDGLQGETTTSMALKQILNSAYQVEVTVRTSSSFVKVMWERMKEILQSMKPFKAPPIVDKDWKRKVAINMLNNLDDSKLAKSICSQFRSRLNNSHDTFSSSLRQLENKHSGRLEKTEEQRMKVRKVHAPRLARLALDSTSLRDMVLYGMPKLEREIGRGQYGVVYSSRNWASLTSLAVKSVVPPDDKHWNDLALEFHYTRSITEHERVVTLRGSVIDHSYGGDGCSPAVLLIMDRLQRDLHVAIKAGLDFPGRLQVALDVVEGMRYLHSLGLVHRDIKLKNVLLDKRDRGKITDLGFCKPEAMMSGSIVGTPIHMAPELFSGKYDSSVDTYAFGILLWYVCAGHVRLPTAFEQCANKDHLWSSVKKGVRPERLNVFDKPCWELMQACWAGEPGDRPLLGDVQIRLQEIHQRALESRRRASNLRDLAGSKQTTEEDQGRPREIY